MKIFVSGANNIINTISKFKNKGINNKELNVNILSSIIFNYYYFKKDSKKLESKKRETKSNIPNTFISRRKANKN